MAWFCVRHRGLLALLAVGVVVPIAPSVAGQTHPGGTSPASSAPPGSPQNRPVALNLFDQGVQLAREGRCDATPIPNVDKCRSARDFFARAYALDPAGLGALRNLAQLEHALGLTASAARHYRDMIRKAPQDSNPTRKAWEGWANEELGKIQSSIPHLTIAVATTPAPSGLAIRIDSEDIPSAAWGAPIEIDPGPHNVVGDAPGYLHFEASVNLDASESRTVRISLTKAPQAEAPPPPPPPPPDNTHTNEDLGGEAESASSRSPLPWVVMGAGAVALGVGTAYGFIAINQHAVACPGGGQVCTQSAFNKGVADADVSTVLFATGGALVLAGILWEFVFTPGGKPTKQTAGVHPVLLGTGAGLGGSF
jgi:hypothetical protein